MNLEEYGSNLIMLVKRYKKFEFLYLLGCHLVNDKFSQIDIEDERWKDTTKLVSKGKYYLVNSKYLEAMSKIRKRFGLPVKTEINSYIAWADTMANNKVYDEFIDECDKAVGLFTLPISWKLFLIFYMN